MPSASTFETYLCRGIHCVLASRLSFFQEREHRKAMTPDTKNLNKTMKVPVQ